LIETSIPFDEAPLSGLGQIVHFEIAMAREPVSVVHERQCPHQPQAIGKDAHDMDALLDLFVEGSSIFGDLSAYRAGAAALMTRTRSDCPTLSIPAQKRLGS
jgi:hypothetical protein